MTLRQTIVWTALPNGITGVPSDRRPQLSVLVSPQLQSDQPDDPLSGDFADWPARLNSGQVGFTVTAAGLSTPATRIGPPPESDLWRALFGGCVVGDPPAPEQLADSRVYSSYPVAEVHATIKQGHRLLATDNSALNLTGSSVQRAYGRLVAAVSPAPPGVPHPAFAGAALADEQDGTRLRALHHAAADNLLRPDGRTELAARVADAAALAARLAELDPSAPTPVLPAAADPLAQLAAFHQAPPGSGTAPPSNQPVPKLTFHQLLTLLLDFPPLLRRLGLVIDLELPSHHQLPLSASSPATPQTLQVVPVLNPPLADSSVSPATAYLLEGVDTFETAPAPATSTAPAGAPAPTESVRRLLNLALQESGEPQYQAVQLDVDGGGFKVLGLAATVPDQDAEPVRVPALRTSGVSIARSGHGLLLMNRIATAAGHHTDLTDGHPVTFFAEDLTRGYRFDVQDTATGSWQSLHWRNGTYTLPDQPDGPSLPPLTDEGTVQVAITRRPGPDGIEPDPTAPLHIHESLLHWQGWSMAAPRPGSPAQDPSVPAPADPPQPSTPLRTSFLAKPGSLPRLRFGRGYRFRARVVDVAGNCLTPDEATDRLHAVAQDLQALPVLPSGDTELRYGRFEPVPAPVLVPREQYTEGESLEHLVIRSRAGSSATDYASLLTAQTGGRLYRAGCDRHLVPPKTSQLMAEAHGMFDASFGTGGGCDQTYAIARRENGSLLDPGPGVEVVPDGYALHHEDQLALPYLPDPLAHGVALFGVPGLAGSADPAGLLNQAGQLGFGRSPLLPATLAALGGSSVHLDFAGSWPDRRPLRLQLADPGPGDTLEAAPPAPSWDPQARVLTVFLRPGQQAALRLSCYLSLTSDSTDLDQLGLWRWVTEPGQQQVSADQIETALLGGHRMITPLRTVRLVHAVEAPLRAPALNQADLRTLRRAGATNTYLSGTIRLHGATTAKVELHASWTEQLDTPTGPQTVQRFAQVFDLPVALPGEGEDTIVPATEDPEVVPIASYQPFPVDLLTLQGPEPGDESGRTFLSNQEFGDTRHRRIAYQARGVSRFCEYLPEQVATDPNRVGVSGDTVEVDVPSSARPAAPVVVSVLPTFRWTRSTAPDGTRTSRRTGGVRVYLARPWYSSGDGELLGVLLGDPDGQDYPQPAPLAPFVTHWGADPVFNSEALTHGPAESDFPNAVDTRNDVPLTNGTLVEVVGHPVQFDEQRGLWYCDIELTGAPEQTYWPFLRLALARYQPNSLPGLELSEAVLTDFVNLPTPRTVTLTPDPAGPDAFTLLVEGRHYRNNSWESGFASPSDFFTDHNGPLLNPSRDLVDVMVQERLPGTSDPLGWQSVTASVTNVQALLVGDRPEAALGLTGEQQLWHGTITLPAGHQPGRFRIAVRESEHFATDVMESKKLQEPDAPGSFPGEVPGEHPAPHHPATIVRNWLPGGPRLVFAETFEF
ncbi:hypothetical protein [Kitasatospora azatica]|uniref:hypothetical protein n=1 Tax=Kitasatospora azatica TaxID=58347 RepID=UPI00056B686B|nr:hypothetical protein [Kitasatospora azatica]